MIDDPTKQPVVAEPAPVDPGTADTAPGDQLADDREAALRELGQAASTWGRTARMVGIAILVIVLLLAIRLTAPIIPLVFLVFIFSFLFYGPVRALGRRTGWQHTRALTLFYLGLAGVLILGLLLIPRMIEQVNDTFEKMSASVNGFQQDMGTYTPEKGTTTVAGVTVNLDGIIQALRPLVVSASDSSSTLQNVNLDSARGVAAGVSSAVAQWLGGFIVTAAGYTALILFSLLVTYFTLLDWPRLRGALNKWIPEAYDREVSLIFKHLDDSWGGFFRGEFLIALIMTAISWVQYLLMGVPAPWALGILNGFIGVIPGIGGPLSSVIVAIPCLLVGSTVFTGMNNGVFALLVLVVNALVTSLAYTFISPFLLGKRVDVPKTLVMVGSFIGLAAAGILGAFLAVPIISSFLLVTKYIAAKVYGREPFPEEETPPASEGFLTQLYQPLGAPGRIEPVAGKPSEHPIAKLLERARLRARLPVGPDKPSPAPPSDLNVPPKETP